MLSINQCTLHINQVGKDTMILIGGMGDKYNLLDDVTEYFNIGAPPQQVTVK